MKKVEIWVAVIAFVAAMVAVCTYAFFFHLQEIGGPEQWGQFGDYFGGVINPIIGLVTVILIVITLKVTRDEAKSTRNEMDAQLKHLSTQAVLSDMYRRLEGLMLEWDRRLSVVAPHSLQTSSVQNLKVRWTNVTLREALESPQTLQLVKERADGGSEAYRDQALAVFSTDLVPLLQELVTYCDEYDAMAKSTYLSDFYKMRVRRVANILFTGRVLPDAAAQKILRVVNVAN